MTEGRDVPGDGERPVTEPADGAGPPAAEAPSEPPTIGWATGVQWEPVDPNPRAAVLDRVTFQIGSVVGRALDTFLRRPMLFVALAIPGALITIVGPAGTAQPTSPWPTLIFFLLDTVVAVPFAVAMIIATDDLRADRNPSFGSVIERALGRTISALISQLVTGIAAAGFVFLPVILGAQSLGAGGGIFVLILFLVVIVYVSIRLMLSQPAIALDQLGPIQGLSSSWAATKGNLWKLIGLTLAIGLLTLPITIGAGILSANANATLAPVVTAIATFIAAPFTSIALATAYGDLTRRPQADRPSEHGPRNRRLLVAAILGLGVVVCLIAIPRTQSALGGAPVDEVPPAVAGAVR
jgi:hypothetical protein